jgi:archaemetzincin
MKALHLVGVGGPSPAAAGLLEWLAARVVSMFRWPVVVDQQWLDASFAFNPLRGQYHSTEILQRLSLAVPDDALRVVGITELDLFIPVLTFVFGEAQVNSPCAVVSYHRLRQEVYGLPADDEVLRERLLKELLHELGHTFGLTHCSSWQCVMHTSHTVEAVDVKPSQFCRTCQARLRLDSSQVTG